WRCLPSQKGLFSECPHRQRPIVVRPDKSKTPPAASQIVNSPSTRIEPLLLMVIFAKLSSLKISTKFQLLRVPRRKNSPQIPMSLGLATINENARSALDCGSSTYRFPPSIRPAHVQGKAV